MESVEWRRNSCNHFTVFVLSFLLLLSPALSIRSSRLVRVPLASSEERQKQQDEPAVVSNSFVIPNALLDDGETAAGVSTDPVVDDPGRKPDFDLRSPRFVGHERKLMGSSPSEGWLEVELLHRHHPGASGAGRRLKDSEHLPERILLDTERQMRQKQQLRAQLSRPFPKLAANDPNAGSFEFLSPVVSGSGLGSGQYFIDFYLGTPAQKFSLIADTGSDIIWVQCAPCISCYSQVGPLFSPSDSSTYSALTCSSDECQYVPPPLNATCDPRNPGVCDYAYGYSDGSQTVGVFATETATMNVSKAGKNVKIGNVAFGCGFENAGPSLTAAGGIIGLGQGVLSFTSQIGGYFSNQFSYCLVNYLDAPTISSTLVFGDVGSKAKGAFQSTPFVSNPYIPSLYYVGIQCLSVGGVRLPVPAPLWQIDSVGSGGTILDSGTTLTIFLQPAYLIILNAFETQITCYPRVAPAQGLDFCFDTSSAGSGLKLSYLPSMSITFDSGAVFNPPNDNIYVSVATNTYCLAMAGSSGPFGYNVLGNLIQQNFEITYDRQNQKFSFAPAQCSSS